MLGTHKKIKFAKEEKDGGGGGEGDENGRVKCEGNFDGRKDGQLSGLHIMRDLS